MFPSEIKNNNSLINWKKKKDWSNISNIEASATKRYRSADTFLSLNSRSEDFYERLFLFKMLDAEAVKVNHKS